MAAILEWSGLTSAATAAMQEMNIMGMKWEEV